MSIPSPPATPTTTGSATGSGAHGSSASSTLKSGLLDIALDDVHVYVSAQAAQFRKAKRKEREALEAQTGGRPMLKERSSFMNLNINKILLPQAAAAAGYAGISSSNASTSTSAGASGTWRRATLRLMEHVNERRITSYLLQVQEESHTTSIYLEKLVSSDIREVHRSLFHLRDCIGIYNSTWHQTSTPSSPDNPPEPMYLHFPCASSLSTWLALFRSCVQIECLGTQLASPTQGGLFRIWRSLELELICGRNIGSSTFARKEVSSHLKAYGRRGYGGGANPPPLGKAQQNASHSPPGTDESNVSVSEDDIFCTIYVAGQLAAGSSVQGAPPKSDTPSLAPIPSAGNTPLWQEVFSFSNLPKFSDTPATERSENNILRILVYRVPRRSAIDRLVQGAKPFRNVITTTPPTSHFGSTLAPNANNSGISVSMPPGGNATIPSSTSSLSHHAMPLPSPSAAAFEMYNATSSNSYFNNNNSNANEKSPAHVLIGKVDIPLASFRRGEAITGHYPIVPEPPFVRSPGGVVFGELKLCVKVDEEIVLPQERYATLLSAIKSSTKSGSALSLAADIDKKFAASLGLASSSPTRSAALAPAAAVRVDLMRAALVTGNVLKDLCDAVSIEIAESAKNNTPLFRGNSPVTLWGQRAMKYWGRDFLSASLGPSINLMFEKNAAFEAERAYLPDNVSSKDLANGVSQLVKWCQEIWTGIYNRREDCPPEIRQMLTHVRSQVDLHYTSKKDKPLRLQSVVSFCFLRLFVPAILDPYGYHVTFGAPTPAVSRSLKQVGRVMQVLANMNDPKGTFHEDYQRPVLEFLQNHSRAMEDYLLIISKPAPWQAEVQQNTLDHLAALKQLSANLPTLHRESIPGLPHSYDLTRILASIASGIARHIPAPDPGAAPARPRAATIGSSQTHWDRQIEEPAVSRVDAFITECYEIERDVVKTLARLEAPPQSQSDTRSRGGSQALHGRSRSVSSASSGSSASLSPQFQSFALSPSPPSSSPIAMPRRPSGGALRPPLAKLQFSSTSAASLRSSQNSYAAALSGPTSPVPSEDDVYGSAPMLEIPSDALDPHVHSRNAPPPPSDIPSFASSSSAPSSTTLESLGSEQQQRRRSIVKSPSRTELGRSATKKRSGFFKNMLEGRKDK